MEWHELFPADRQPDSSDFAAYLGDAAALWTDLETYFETAYKAKPKLTYSTCSGKPGWNVKYQKGGQAFGTFYPSENYFEVMLVFSYKLDAEVQLLLPVLSEATASLYREAGDFMKIGKWMMLRIDGVQPLDDYKKMIAVKRAPLI